MGGKQVNIKLYLICITLVLKADQCTSVSTPEGEVGGVVRDQEAGFPLQRGGASAVSRVAQSISHHHTHTCGEALSGKGQGGASSSRREAFNSLLNQEQRTPYSENDSNTPEVSGEPRKHRG